MHANVVPSLVYFSLFTFPWQPARTASADSGYILTCCCRLSNSVDSAHLQEFSETAFTNYLFVLIISLCGIVFICVFFFFI